jgi:hypothetical protein
MKKRWSIRIQVLKERMKVKVNCRGNLHHAEQFTQPEKLSTSLLNPRSQSQSYERPAWLGVRHPFGAHTHIFITARQLRVCWCGAPSPKRGRVCSLYLLLVLASVVTLESESRRTHDHIPLSQTRDSANHGYSDNIGLLVRSRNWHYGRRGSAALIMRYPSIRKSWH